MAVPANLASALGDRYRLDRELGQGGMATVYLAHDLRHDRDVALKVLRPELAAVLGRARFLTEIRLTAKLDHPYIVTLIDSGESDGFLWYVVPFIRGESLREKLTREGQLTVQEALAIVTQVAGALDYAHRQGVIHRDIKPENILLQEGHAVLADFGIALAVREAGGNRLTETGLSLGTPQYMSPEQATGDRELDARSDVYSLGAVLYEALAGEPPHAGPTVQAVIAKLMTTEPVRLRILRPSVPSTTDEAVHRALAKVPADRWPSATAFAAALAERHGLQTWRPGRRSIRTVGVMVLLLVTLAALVSWWFSRLPRHHSPTPDLVALAQEASHDYARRTGTGVNRAIQEFSIVVQRDSNYAAAWAGLSKAYSRAYLRYFTVPGVPRDSVLQLAVAAADRAMASDRGDPTAWLARAIVTRSLDPTNVGPSLQAARQSLVLDSTGAEARHYLAMALAESGDLEGAVEEWRNAVRVDPSYTEAVAFLGWGHYWHRQFDSAQVWADSAVALDPLFTLGRGTSGYVALERGDFARAAAEFDASRRLNGDIEAGYGWAGRALAEARAGRPELARNSLQRAESLTAAPGPVASHTAVFLAEAYAGLGDAHRAMALLRRYEPRGDLHFQLHLRCDPPLDPLRADSGFRSLLIRPQPRTGQGC